MTIRRGPILIALMATLIAMAVACKVSTPEIGDVDHGVAVDLPLAVKSSPTPPPAGLCSGPEPALVTDLQVRQPPASAEPAPRAPFRDPRFGRCVVRVTDRIGDKTEPGGLKNEYSRVQSFNADETRLLVRSTQGDWYLYNAQTLRPLGPLSLGVDPRWSATDPHLIYFSEETRLMAYNIVTQQTAVIHEFADDFQAKTWQPCGRAMRAAPHSMDRRGD